MTMRVECVECGAPVEADDLTGLGERFLAHVRSTHEWPYPDQAIRNHAEASQRLTGPSERLPEIGEIEIHPVTEDRIDDWLLFFDHDGFVGTPEWAACYCNEPHLPVSSDEATEVAHWAEKRAAMVERLRTGGTRGYLAYVDGRPAGWVNASRRCDYARYCRGPAAEPADDDVVGVACFVIAPPYRRHGVASALLDRVIADAPDRGATWVEAYPMHSATQAVGTKDYRGPRPMYDERGFEEVERRERDLVVRRRVP